MISLQVKDKSITDLIQEGSPVANCYNFLADNYKLRYNVITGNVENTAKSINGNYQIIDDTEINTMYIVLSAMYSGRDNKVSKDLLASFIFSGHIKMYNPFIDFIEKHKHIPRSEDLIKQLSECITTDTIDAHKYIKHWGCGMIASIYGSQSPLTLVLAGEKINTGKTEFFRRLLPNELKLYYAESGLDGGKDDDILMCRKLIIMDDEFGGKSKKDQKRFKGMTSKQNMSIRVPYGRTTTEMRRICSLCGTSNDLDLLSDPYGNRRILPINVLSINHELYNKIDKAHLFMAFYDLYESGFHWKFKQEDIETLNKDSDNFLSVNFESELIQLYLKLPDELNSGVLMTNTGIKQYLEFESKQKIFNVTKLGIELKRLGFVQHVEKQNKITQRLYRVVKINSAPTMEEAKRQILDQKSTEEDKF